MRRRSHEPETPWASFSDALSGMLFVFVITTFWYAFLLVQQKRNADAREQDFKHRIEEFDRAADEARHLVGDASRKTLGSLSACIGALPDDRAARGQIEVVPEWADARISMYIEVVGWFGEGKATLDAERLGAVRRIRECIREELGTFMQKHPTYNVRVYLEGHTDAVPMHASGGFESNWELSAARAAAVVSAILAEEAGVENPLNDLISEGRMQVLAVGMAERRPAWSRICFGGESEANLLGDADRTVCSALVAAGSNLGDPSLHTALRDHSPPHAAGYWVCGPPTERADLDKQSTLELLIRWANRCPGSDDEADRRRGNLRRVDLRLEVSPDGDTDG
jgi:flagellar motor protein MotB